MSILNYCMETTSTIEIQSLQRLCEKGKNEEEALRIEVMKLQLQLHKPTQIVFGGKSERFVVNPAQLTLDNYRITLQSCG